MSINTVAENRCFEGVQGIYSHTSSLLGCSMRFSVYTPPGADREPCPAVFWLSGLTCTEENFTFKAGAQQYAARHGLIVVAPDTSPRGADVADDEAWDFGCGAGFYLNATEEPWSRHYRMYDYIADELPGIIRKNFPVRAGALGIMGHSMGGHGALVMGLRNPEIYASVSAFAPIVAPVQIPWGQKAFTGYLGDDQSTWQQYDATALIKAGSRTQNTILIDQGSADDFLDTQLKPHLFEDACHQAGQPVKLRLQDGYDHSYFFIASFMAEHMAHHAGILANY